MYSEAMLPDSQIAQSRAACTRAARRVKPGDTARNGDPRIASPAEISGRNAKAEAYMTRLDELPRARSTNRSRRTWH